MQLIKQLLEMSQLTEDASELSVGDPVIVTGNVQFKGQTGDIDSFGSDKRFVVVNLYNSGKHSFHSSDISYNDDAEDMDEDDDTDDENESEGFFFTVIDEDSPEDAWIGHVAREGTKWHELDSYGAADHRFGSKTYMGYLSVQDVMNYMIGDFAGRLTEVYGPYETLAAAQRKVEELGGEISESVVTEGRMKDAIFDLIEKAINMTDYDGMKYDAAVKAIVKKAKALDTNELFGSASDKEIAEYVKGTFTEEDL